MNRVIIAGSANPHVPGYLHEFVNGGGHGLYRIIALSEPDPVRMQVDKNILGEVPMKYYDSWKTMMDSHPEADTILIGTDNPEHIHVFRYAIEKHLHICMMKVISTSEKECREMLELEKGYDKTIQVELELRYTPQFLDARRIVREGKLGKIRSIYASNISHCPCNYFPNWGDPALSWGERIPVRPGSPTYRGGGLTDHPHPMDMIRWITGREFATVYAVCAPNQRKWMEVEDQIVLCGELDDGTKYMINPSYGHWEGDPQPGDKVYRFGLRWAKYLECNLKISGEKGYFSCDFDMDPLFVIGKGHRSPDRLQVAWYPGMPGVQSYTDKMDVFCGYINGTRSAPYATLYDSYQTVRVMNAAYESAYSGKTITLL